MPQEPHLRLARRQQRQTWRRHCSSQACTPPLPQPTGSRRRVATAPTASATAAQTPTMPAVGRSCRVVSPGGRLCRRTHTSSHLEGVDPGRQCTDSAVESGHAASYVRLPLAAPCAHPHAAATRRPRPTAPRTAWIAVHPWRRLAPSLFSPGSPPFSSSVAQEQPASASSFMTRTAPRRRHRATSSAPRPTASPTA